MRISGYITKLEPNEIFVFGSNLSGFHGAGAAKTALKWGAKWGIGEGLVGRTYALPTVKANIRGTLSIEAIASHVDKFILCAKKHPELKFMVTEIGCGLAGLTAKQIAPLFRQALEIQNIYLPAKFIKHLERS